MSQLSNKSSTYGTIVGRKKATETLGLSKDDIYVNQPSDLGIFGEDLVKNFKNAIKHLNVDDKIDIKDSTDRIE